MSMCKRCTGVKWSSHCRIVAPGRVATTVLAEAARITGRRAEELPLVSVINPLLELPH
jgi:hypothetical protein